MNIPPAQLSCQQCKKRKKRCDKKVPCGACVQASIECTAVQRHRLPRGRSGRKPNAENDVLRERVARLEAVIARMQTGQTHTRAQPLDSTLNKAMESFVAPDFWTELTETVAGLRDVLESPEADEDGDGDRHDESMVNDEYSQAKTLCQDHDGSLDSDAHLLLFNDRTTSPLHEIKLLFDPWLLQIYRERVDAIFKVLHWPSLLSLLGSHGRQGDDLTDVTPEAQALVSAMQFTATCSFLEYELPDRQRLINERRRNTEELFARADLLTSTSLMLLQAFVIYLAGLRTCQANAQQWTLTATAVRLANAQGIPYMTPDSCSPLDADLRRRVWHCICVLDMQSAFDRGSRTMVSSGDMKTLPMHINDSDIVSTTMSPPHEKEHFADMTFSVLIYKAGYCQRKMTEIGNAAFGGIINSVAAAHQQKSTLTDFERGSGLLVALCDTPSSTALQKFTAAVAAESLVAMRLLLYRPLHKRPKHSIQPEEDVDVLGIALSVLQRSRNKRSWFEFAQWAWFSWVKWYALAVVLAEICALHGAINEASWDTVQHCYDDYANAVADAKSGLLWKPVARLMAKVKAMRKERTPHAGKEVAIDSTKSNPFEEDSAITMELSAAINVAQVDTIDEDLAWVHWDMLIDDINDFSHFDL